MTDSRYDALELLRDHNPENEGFIRLYERFTAFGEAFLPIYGLPLPSAKAALRSGVS